MNDEIIAIVPARANSKTVKHKNVRMLRKHPVLAYSIMVAKKSKYIDNVFVSTDSENYASLAKQYGAEVPFLRPDHLASDTATDIDVMLHFLEWYKSHHGKLPKYLVHLRPTTPLRDPVIIDRAINTIITTKKKCTALRSVHEMSETAYKCFEIDDCYLKTIKDNLFDLEKANDVRQHYPKTYHANGYVDILKTDYVLQKKKTHGDKVLHYLTDHTVEIDTEEDFAYLEYQITKKQELFKQLFEN